MSLNNNKITRHGNFLSTLKIDYKSIANEVVELINSETETKNNSYIYKKIQKAFLDIKEEKLRFINEYDRDTDDFYITSQEINWLLKNKKEDWLKYLTYRYNFKILPLKKVVTDFPQYVLIEPVSICNLRSSIVCKITSTSSWVIFNCEYINCSFSKRY